MPVLHTSCNSITSCSIILPSKGIEIILQNTLVILAGLSAQKYIPTTDSTSQLHKEERGGIDYRCHWDKGMQDLESAPLYLAFSLVSGQIFWTLSQSLRALGLGAHSPVPGDESPDKEISVPKYLHPGPSIRTSGRLGENSPSSSFRDPEALTCDVLGLPSCLGAGYVIVTQC